MKARLILSLLFLISCNDDLSVKFVAEKEFNSSEKVDGLLFGGVSGLVKVGANSFVGVSDDRGERGYPRFFKLNLDNEKVSSISPKNWIPLLNDKGENFEVGSIDFEGVTTLPTGNILLSSEGDARKEPIIPPRISEYTMGGLFVRHWPVPKKFIPNSTTSASKGVAFNLGFESLSSTEDGRYVFTANEEALIQDRSEDKKKKEPLRIIKYSYGKVVGEYVYPLEKIPNPDNFKTLEGNNGLVDLLALDEYRLIAVERAFIKNNYRNIVRLYLINLKSATDVQHKYSLKDVSYKSVEKRLLFDLDNIKDNLEKRKLDNIEGIAWGPKTKEGKRTLLLVSDNNFSKHQRTLFLQLEL